MKNFNNWRLLKPLITVSVGFVVFFVFFYLSSSLSSLRSTLASVEQQFKEFKLDTEREQGNRFLERLRLDLEQLKESVKKGESERVQHLKEQNNLGRKLDSLHRSWVRTEKWFSKKQKKKKKNHTLRILFSTDCKVFQRWQSRLLFYSAQLAGETAHITQLMSGCSEEEKEVEKKRYSAYHHHSVHFTPQYSEYEVNGTQRVFKPLNKACAFEHFLDHVKDDELEEFIAILDSDFIFTKPLEFNTRHTTSADDPLIIYSGGRPPAQVNDTVKEGISVAQQYALGATFLDYRNIFLDLYPSTPLRNISVEQATEYAVGPPYILHKSDFRRLMPLYCSFTRKILQISNNNWLSEMYGYVLASIHLSLHQTKLDHFMVSQALTFGEALQWVDALSADPNPCDPAFLPHSLPIEKLPTFIHYCQEVSVTPEMGFFKYRVPDSILDCSSPIFTLPPPSLWTTVQDDWKDIITNHHSWSDDKKHNRSGQHWMMKRNVYLLCSIVPILNEMLIDWKENNCFGQYNSQQLIRWEQRSFVLKDQF